MLRPRRPAPAALFVLTLCALALIFSSNAFTKAHGAHGGLRATEETTDETFNTDDVAVAAAAKPLPICKKKQKSTKKKPCRKKPKKFSALRANPPVAGWKLGLFVSHSNDGMWALSVRLARTSGNVTERHFYAFRLAASCVTVGPDLSTATIDTGTQLGQFGAIKLTFGNVGALGAGTAVPGCTGNWQKRTGTLTGSIRFVANSTYFKTILRTSVPATLNANIGPLPTCKAQPPACVHTTLLAVGTFTGASNFFEAFNTAGVLTFVGFFTQTVGPAIETHVLSETNLPASDFSTAADLSSATVSTTGAKAFTGSLNYTAGGPATKFPNAGCGGTPASFTQGTATGGISAKFAAIPAAQPPLTPATAEIL